MIPSTKRRNNGKVILPSFRNAIITLSFLPSLTNKYAGGQNGEFCTLCPNGSEPSNRDRDLLFYEFNGKKITCQEAAVDIKMPADSENCQELKRYSVFCGCPNAPPMCTICSEGNYITNNDSKPIPDFTFNGKKWTCTEMDDIASIILPEDDRCTTIKDNAADYCGCTITVVDPTNEPTTPEPSIEPTSESTPEPTHLPTKVPTPEPTDTPTEAKTDAPTTDLPTTPEPTDSPTTPEPTDSPTPEPSTIRPTVITSKPSEAPTTPEPTDTPSTVAPTSADPTTLATTTTPATPNPTTQKPTDSSTGEEGTDEPSTSVPSISPTNSSGATTAPFTFEPSMADTTLEPTHQSNYTMPGFNDNTGTDNNKTEIYLSLFVGIGGIIASLLLAGVWVYMRRRQRRKKNFRLDTVSVNNSAIRVDDEMKMSPPLKEKEENGEEISEPDIDSNGHEGGDTNKNDNVTRGNPFISEICLDTSNIEDISTLGDPIGPFGDHISVNDDSTDIPPSEQYDYDYKHSLLGVTDNYDDYDEGSSVEVERGLAII